MQLFLTSGLKSFSPFMRIGYVYSSLPLKRKFDRFLAAKALMLGLGDEQSFIKVLMAIRAKF
jgi:hypothetical protein